MSVNAIGAIALCLAITVFLGELALSQPDDVFTENELLIERTYYLDECATERGTLVVPQDLHDARAPDDPQGHQYAMECFSGWTASNVDEARSLVVFQRIGEGGAVTGLVVDVYDPNGAWGNTAYAMFLQRIRYSLDQCGLWGDVFECPADTQGLVNQRPQLRWNFDSYGFLEVLSK